VVYAAVVGALYFVMVTALAPVSFGVLQFRAANVLKALAVCRPEFALGYALGDFFANQASPFGVWDWGVMPAFDVLGALVAWWLRGVRVRGLPWLSVVGQSVVVAVGVATFPLGLGGGFPWTVSFVSVVVSTVVVVGVGTMVLLPAYKAVFGDDASSAR
jgi:uncharacterized membrane protein